MWRSYQLERFFSHNQVRLKTIFCNNFCTFSFNAFLLLPDSSPSTVTEDTYETSSLLPPQTSASYYYNNKEQQPSAQPAGGRPTAGLPRTQQTTSSRLSSRADATWSEWSEWTDCSPQCRPGESQARSRQCQSKPGDGPPYIDVQNCAKVVY